MLRWPPFVAAALLVSAALLAGLPAREPDGPRRTAPAARSNPFLEWLCLVQACGRPEAVEPARDGQSKTIIAAALKSGPSIPYSTVASLMSPESFNVVAGENGRIEPDEVRRHLDSSEPESRRGLFPAVAAHMRQLASGLDQIDELHQERGAELADWIVRNYRAGQPLSVICVCTGNSRRSLLAATLGNVAAAWHGMPDIRFYSGGTEPSAFNRRTITALRDVGLEIEPTGDEAERGSPDTSNPIYSVRWGRTAEGQALEALECSKRFDDRRNPQEGFAALLVCSDADAACPSVKGASIRIPMPYLDPKLYDDTDLEAAKYAERRDDIGRLMMSVLMQARLRLAAAKGSR